MHIRPKKHLGQHFLRDANIARKIVEALPAGCPAVLEIGPGKGILTGMLAERYGQLTVVEKDTEAAVYLRKNFDEKHLRILEGDFLRLPPDDWGQGEVCLIGNLPYNITGPIFFKVLEAAEKIPAAVFMIQKEVAERIVAPPGNKTYGILSVLLQNYFDIEYLFGVPPQVFTPPPKVHSAVIRLIRKDIFPPVDRPLFVQLVKTAFNQRRKTLRNSLKKLNLPHINRAGAFLAQRAEQLSPADFVKLYQKLYGSERKPD